MWRGKSHLQGGGWKARQGLQRRGVVSFPSFVRGRKGKRKDEQAFLKAERMQVKAELLQC